MPRGILPDEFLKDIDMDIPKVAELITVKRNLNIFNINLICGPRSKIQISANCLHDAIDLLLDSRIALFECYAHEKYYREFKHPPDERTANYMKIFFLEDLSFRLYASAENLANAIIFMLEIGDVDLKEYRKMKASNQANVGIFLLRKKPDHPITIIVKRLIDSQDWNLSVDYRNKIVHDQTPTIEGLGLVYQRRSRWEEGENGQFSLGIGGSDAPEYTTLQVRTFLENGFKLLMDVTEEVSNFYIELIRGIKNKKFPC